MTNEIGKKILIAILIITVAILCVLPLFYNPDNNNATQRDLDRLQEIGDRIKEIGEEKVEVQANIDGLKMVLSELDLEKETLSNEAAEIFNSIINQQNDSSELVRISEEEVADRQPGQLTEDQTNQEMPPIDESISDSHERFKALANAYGLDPSQIREVENHYGLTESLILCISIAETSGGKFGAGENNIGNVGNTDSNPRGNSYSNIGASLDAIGRTLNNKYLGSKQTLGCLSNWHHCEEPNDNGKRYATSSPETSGAWEPNMVACLETVYGKGKVDPATFNIRNR